LDEETLGDAQSDFLLPAFPTCKADARWSFEGTMLLITILGCMGIGQAAAD